MKLHRKDYPKIRERVKHGKSYFEVDMRRKGLVGRQYRTFTQLKDARKYAAEVASKVSLSGLDSLGDMLRHRQDLELLNDLRQRCGHYGKTIQQAVLAATKTWEDEEEKQKSPFTSELLTLWVLDKTEGLKRLRPKTLKTIRNMAEAFKAKWGEYRIREITHPMVESWLKKAAGGDYRKRNLLSNFSAFFNHIRKKKYYEGENPCDGLEIEIERTTPGFLTAEQSRLLMRESQRVEGLAPYVALGLFAGIRPEEAQRMDWPNIKLDTSEIHNPCNVFRIPPAKARMESRPSVAPGKPFRGGLGSGGRRAAACRSRAGPTPLTWFSSSWWWQNAFPKATPAFSIDARSPS
ncbi:MAG: hypothetical protein KJ072_08320 [Verrucomicrobia bacterium]|nr:hypothetical protein [Verrucomicrobiota bacterium]